MIKKIFKKISGFLFLFNPFFNKNFLMRKIGTTYGGYDIYDENLTNPVVISCGLGEDATFDVDMINKYNAKIISIDPTPRAKNHYLKIKENFGKKNKLQYDESGKLDAKCYDLKKANKENFFFLDKAIWNDKEKQIKLFFPKNNEYVSCSINSNLENQQNFFLSETISYDQILNFFNLSKIDILKLDIEGAEIEVLKNVLSNKNLPKQILVEFDIRRSPSYRNALILKEIHNMVLEKYILVNINQKGDFTYIIK